MHPPMTSKPTLADLATSLANGSVSSRSLVEACLERIADPAGEGRTTFLHVDESAVLAQADAMDCCDPAARPPRPTRESRFPSRTFSTLPGRLAGRIDGAREPAGRDPGRAQRRSPTAGGLRAHRRTNMSEFAFSGLGLNPHYGTPRNPWKRADGHIPGGSSSGAAISVTDGMAHAALGTDTGGSCRIPAAFTGLVGYKPTARRVPRDGAIPLSTTLDSIGPIARSVACCATLDSILANDAPPDLTDPSPSGMRFGVPKTFVLEDMDSTVAAHFERSLSRLSAAGARIERLDIPEFAGIPTINAKGGFSAAESYTWHRSLIESGGTAYDPRVLTRIQRGATQSATDYIELLAARKTFIAAVETRIARFDALLFQQHPSLHPGSPHCKATPSSSA